MLNSFRHALDVLIYTSLGRAFTHRGMDFPSAPEDRRYMAEFLRKVPMMVSEGRVKPNPIKFWDGGLDSIPQGLQYMREGKASGEKIVYRI